MNHDLDLLKIIEDNHLGHFVYLPKELNFDVSKVHGVFLINCGLETSMFNIAYGLPEYYAGDFSWAVLAIKKEFLGQPFAWWVPSSNHNKSFTKTLLENGFIIETAEHAMICDLNDAVCCSPQTNMYVQHVTNRDLLKDFIDVLGVYDKKVVSFYGQMPDDLFLSNEKLVVGYVNDKPVTIGILYVSGHGAGIFSLITKDEEQRKGYGTEMMFFLINMARGHGCRYVTLSASSESGYRIYERIGFRKVGEFECFEHKGEPA